jgi:SPP1 family predicted phage head-tail adaptor
MPAHTFELGKMRHFITINKMLDSLSASGAVTETASTYATAYAEIIPLSGSEDYEAMGISADVVYRIRTRYIAGVTPKMQITWDGRTFTISSVRNIDEMNRWMVFECVEDV